MARILVYHKSVRKAEVLVMYTQQSTFELISIVLLEYETKMSDTADEQKSSMEFRAGPNFSGW